MRFSEWLLLEGFWTDRYSLPKDKEQQLYDFYLFSSILGDIGYGSLEIQRQIPHGQHKAIPYGNLQEKLEIKSQEVAKTLFPELKKNLLNAVFFSICAEMRHVLDMVEGYGLDNKIKQVEQVCGRKFSQLFADFITRYQNRNDLHSFLSKPNPEAMKSIDTDALRKANIPGAAAVHYKSRNRLSGASKSYRKAYTAALEVSPSRKKFVQLSEYCFRDKRNYSRVADKKFSGSEKMNQEDAIFSWTTSYGGENWRRISAAWLNLHDAQTLQEQMLYIDVIWDLQHNSNTVFNKVKQYAKDGGFGWLREALDKKFRIKIPYEIWPKSSKFLQEFSGYVLRHTHGSSLEAYNKISSIHHEEEHGGWLLEFTKKSNTSKNKARKVQIKLTWKQLIEIFESSGNQSLEVLKKHSKQWFAPEHDLISDENNIYHPGPVGLNKLINYIQTELLIRYGEYAEKDPVTNNLGKMRYDHDRALTKLSQKNQASATVVPPLPEKFPDLTRFFKTSGFEKSLPGDEIYDKYIPIPTASNIALFKEEAPRTVAEIFMLHAKGDAKNYTHQNMSIDLHNIGCKLQKHFGNTMVVIWPSNITEANDLIESTHRKVLLAAKYTVQQYYENIEKSKDLDDPSFGVFIPSSLLIFNNVNAKPSEKFMNVILDVFKMAKEKFNFDDALSVDGNHLFTKSLKIQHALVNGRIYFYIPEKFSSLSGLGKKRDMNINLTPAQVSQFHQESKNNKISAIKKIRSMFEPFIGLYCAKGLIDYIESNNFDWKNAPQGTPYGHETKEIYHTIDVNNETFYFHFPIKYNMGTINLTKEQVDEIKGKNTISASKYLYDMFNPFMSLICAKDLVVYINKIFNKKG